MSEALLTCPTCQTAGFTKRGLKAHRCNGVTRHPERSVTQSKDPAPHAPTTSVSTPRRAKPLTLATLDILPPASSGDPDKDMGAQLTEQYHRATGGMLEVLKFGAMMLQLEGNLSARGQVSGGRGQKGGVSEWLRTHAPDVNHSTAYRFKSVTEAISQDYTQIVGAKVAKQFALPALVTTPADQLPEPIRAKQLELFDFVRGTSQRSWLDRFAPAKRSGGNTYERGGDKGKPKTLTAEEAAELLKGLCSRAGETLAAVHRQKAYVALNDAELEGLVDHLDAVSRDVRAWKKLSAAERKAALAEQVAAHTDAK